MDEFFHPTPTYDVWIKMHGGDFAVVQHKTPQQAQELLDKVKIVIRDKCALTVESQSQSQILNGAFIISASADKESA